MLENINCDVLHYMNLKNILVLMLARSSSQLVDLDLRLTLTCSQGQRSRYWCVWLNPFWISVIIYRNTCPTSEREWSTKLSPNNFSSETQLQGEKIEAAVKFSQEKYFKRKKYISEHFLPHCFFVWKKFWTLPPPEKRRKSFKKTFQHKIWIQWEDMDGKKWVTSETEEIYPLPESRFLLCWPFWNETSCMVTSWGEILPVLVTFLE